MKDEIKEILEALKPQDEEFTKAGIKEYPLALSAKEQKILRDYITNLQEENERLKEIHKLNELICEIAKYDTNQIKITRKKLEECLFTIREVEEMKNWLKESELDEQIKNDN